MIGNSLLRGRLLHCFSPRVLCVASNLLYKHNQYINNGYNQYRYQQHWTHNMPRVGFGNGFMSVHQKSFVSGPLKVRQCWNFLPCRSYSRRFSPEFLTDSEIIDGMKSGKITMADIIAAFSLKRRHKERKYSGEIGKLIVNHFSPMEHLDPKSTNLLLNSLINLQSPINPSFINLPISLLRAGSNKKKLYNDLMSMVGLLPLLNWSSPPPKDKLLSISDVIMPMISSVDNRCLTYLYHTWCNRWTEIATENLVTEDFLKEFQQRVPGLNGKDMMQLLEAISICLPLRVQLSSGWLGDVQKWLLMQNIGGREAATLLDAFEQIQRNCCPTQQHLSVPVAKHLFRLQFDPKQNCVGRNALLTCLVLRALSELGIDPALLDERFWPWFWKNSGDSLNKWSDDQRVMVLDALYQLRITAAPKKWLQQIINTIRADNPMLSTNLLYSLFRIKEIVPGIVIPDTILRSLAKAVNRAIPKLSGKDLVVGAWSLAQHEFNPRKVHSQMWEQFFNQSEKHIDAFSSHQQLILLTVVYKFHLEPPIDWMKSLLAAIDKTPPDSAHGAAHILWYLMLLHKHYPHRTKNRQLLEVLAGRERIINLYNHWVNEMDSLKLRELLFTLATMNYFGLDPTVGHPDVFDKWCNCMQKYFGKSKIEEKDKDLLLEIVHAFENQLPNWFVGLVKQNLKL